MNSVLNSGRNLGRRLDWQLGTELGRSLGERLGIELGTTLGTTLGTVLGNELGTKLGSTLGISERTWDGSNPGAKQAWLKFWHHGPIIGSGSLGQWTLSTTEHICCIDTIRSLFSPCRKTLMSLFIFSLWSWHPNSCFGRLKVEKVGSFRLKS